VTKEAQIVTKTLQISSDNKSANECQNCRKVTGSSKEALDFCVPVTKEAQIVPKTLQIGDDNKSANECQNCRKVTVAKT
jgi:hypothetical protein